jgi:hypothetical protein
MVGTHPGRAIGARLARAMRMLPLLAALTLSARVALYSSASVDESGQLHIVLDSGKEILHSAPEDSGAGIFWISTYLTRPPDRGLVGELRGSRRNQLRRRSNCRQTGDLPVRPRSPHVHDGADVLGLAVSGRRETGGVFDWPHTRRCGRMRAPRREIRQHNGQLAGEIGERGAGLGAESTTPVGATAIGLGILRGALRQS